MKTESTELSQGM